ncbi:MAG: L,D-transpeptidase [Chitinophagaceae bacterium]
MGKINSSGFRFISIVMGIIFFSAASCKTERNKKLPEGFEYNEFRDSLIKTDTGLITDTAKNLFDESSFTPGVDSLNTLLVMIDTLWHQEAALMEHLDTLKRGIKKGPGFTPEEIFIIRENIKVLDSFLIFKNIPDSVKCKGIDCILYAEIDKSAQLLYLYILGELKDTFKISSGLGKYETPNLDLHPGGPVLTKYTSRKFPGGNYKGLGNMPYAVFLQGGYAIHGTTMGNFPKLGTKASHGCIRLHPDNAKVFNALVKTVGLQETWVSIKDSLQ